MTKPGHLSFKPQASEKAFSVHKLIEYAFSTPQRRTAIIENAITPPVFIMDTKYPDIERATASYLASQLQDDGRLNALDTAYLARTNISDHEERRLLNAHDAIEHVKQMDWPKAQDATFYNNGGLLECMEICGLRIRVKPTALIKRELAGHKTPSIGVAKAYFGKCFPLEKKGQRERGCLFATLLHWYAEQALPHLGVAEPSLCFVGDVFSEKTYVGAKRYKQRRKQIEALAQEICDRWEPISLRMIENTEQKKLQLKANANISPEEHNALSEAISNT